MVKQHTTLPNSSLNFFKITVARLHPLLRIAQISSRKLNISQKTQKETPLSHLMSVLSSPAYQYLLYYKLSIPKFLPAPIIPMSTRSLWKTSSSFRNSLYLNASSASTRNSVNGYRIQPWVHLSPPSLPISTWNTLNPKPFLYLQQ